MKCSFCGRELTSGESPEMYKGLCYACYMETRPQELSYRLTADVNVKDLFTFIVENVPYKKVMQLRDLLNVSVATSTESEQKKDWYLDQVRFLRGE